MPGHWSGRLLMEDLHLEQALRVAGRLAGSYPLVDGYHRRVLEQIAPEMVERAARMVQEETGLPGGGVPKVAVIDRFLWVERNLAFFSALLSPVEMDLKARLAEKGTGDGFSERLMAIEMGILLGLLSHRVLGQYEMVLPSAGNGDEICILAPNILEFERRYQLRPSEFRFWIALHEATHRLQFVGVPWLRSYFLELTASLLRVSKPDESRLALLVSAIQRAGSEGILSVGEAGIPGLMATPGELRQIDKVQALMSLLEGHGHVVMDRIGARRLVTWSRMSALVTRRRENPRIAALMRLTGLEMKLRQYEEGRDFILHVERQAGWAAVGLAWESPETLPTRSEIKAPESWLARVG